MLILLPPSETKRPDGLGAPLDLDTLSFRELTPLRRSLLDELVTLAADLPAARRALAVGPGQDHEILRNATLFTAGTLPALDRYTGVLYDHLGAASLSKVQRSRADQRLVIASALFGASRATDLIPAYRLSAGSRLPDGRTLASRWRPVLSPVLAEADEFILDLRSAAYASLAPVPAAVTVAVVTENALGTRTVVSHFSKATKGILARVLCVSRAEINTIPAVIRAARTAGVTVERSGLATLTVVT